MRPRQADKILAASLSGTQRNGSTRVDSLHQSRDRATPFHWSRHERTWSSQHCALLDECKACNLEECKASCLADERCTAFNFHMSVRHGCEARHCAQGEQPTAHRRDWSGFSSFSASESPPLPPPLGIAQLVLLTATASLVLGAVFVAFLAQRRLSVHSRLPSPRYPGQNEPRGESFFARIRLPSMRGIELEPLSQASTTTPINTARRGQSPVLCCEDEERWSPVLTDPCACTSRDFLCGTATATRGSSPPHGSPRRPALSLGI